MPQYEPHLIAQFKTGRYISHEPWLAPADAFPTLVNARVNKGVLEKRLGITLLGTTGQSNPIMGLFQYRHKGVPRCIFFDTKRAYKLDFSDNTVTDLIGSDTFTGSDKDFFRFAAYGNTMYVCNGQSADGVYKYDANSNAFTKLPITEDLGCTQFGAKMIFQFPAKNRILLVGTIEDGEYCPTRIRYSDVDTDTFSPLSYIDGRFDDIPICGSVLGKEILIFCQSSVWRIRYTGDTDNPFTWEPVSGSQGHGSITPFVCEGTQNGLVTINDRHITFCNGYEVAELDVPHIRDVRAEMDTANIVRAYGCAPTADRNIYIAYPPDGSTYNTRILDYNGIEQNWAVYSSALVFHCLGTFSGQITTRFTRIDTELGGDTLADIAASGMDPIRDRETFTLFGDRAGNIYQLNSGTSDNTAAIEMDIRTARLNPYAAAGHKVRLGWVDLLVDNDSTASATVYFYKDSGTTAYKTLTLSCDGDNDKHWVRLNVGGEVGNFHEMKIYNIATANRPRIHAIEFWAAPAGRLT